MLDMVFFQINIFKNIFQCVASLFIVLTVSFTEKLITFSFYELLILSLNPCQISTLGKAVNRTTVSFMQHRSVSVCESGVSGPMVGNLVTNS